MPSIRARTEAFDRNSFCRSYIQGLYKYNQTSPFGLSSDSGNACHKAHNNNTILCCHPRFPRKETKAWSAHFLILSALIAFECDAFISTRSVASNKRRLSDLTTLEPTKSHGGGGHHHKSKRDSSWLSDSNFDCIVDRAVWDASCIHSTILLGSRYSLSCLLRVVKSISVGWLWRDFLRRRNSICHSLALLLLIVCPLRVRLCFSAFFLLVVSFLFWQSFASSER